MEVFQLSFSGWLAAFSVSRATTSTMEMELTTGAAGAAGAATGASAGAAAGGGVMTGAAAASFMPSFSRMLLKKPMINPPVTS